MCLSAGTCDWRIYSIYTVIYRFNICCFREERMEIIISNSGGKPIYEQITEQIKAQIIDGRLKSGESLPSMRVLAQNLKISVITTKRAYNDLESEGFIEVVAGKGCYVSDKDPQILREGNLKMAEKHISEAISVAKRSGISKEELKDMVDILFEGD